MKRLPIHNQGQSWVISKESHDLRMPLSACKGLESLKGLSPSMWILVMIKKYLTFRFLFLIIGVDNKGWEDNERGNLKRGVLYG